MSASLHFPDGFPCEPWQRNAYVALAVRLFRALGESRRGMAAWDYHHRIAVLAGRLWRKSNPDYRGQLVGSLFSVAVVRTALRFVPKRGEWWDQKPGLDNPYALCVSLARNIGMPELIPQKKTASIG